MMSVTDPEESYTLAHPFTGGEGRRLTKEDNRR